MKFIITDYSSNSQSESLYFHKGLSLLEGCSSALWNTQRISAYDIFDMVKPDIFMTHINSISTDALSYLKKEDSKIGLIVNITGANQSQVTNTENFLKTHNINCLFFFTNADEINITTSKMKVLSIQLGANIFPSHGIALSYRLNKGIMISNQSQISPTNNVDDQSYHYISHNTEINDIADIVLPVDPLCGLYKHYSEIVFKYFSTVVPQEFYDSIYHGNKTYFDIDDVEKKSMINSKFKKIFNIDSDICDSSSIDSNIIQSRVRNKHTCLHRLKSLLSQLPCHDIVQRLQVIIGDIK